MKPTGFGNSISASRQNQRRQKSNQKKNLNPDDFEQAMDMLYQAKYTHVGNNNGKGLSLNSFGYRNDDYRNNTQYNRRDSRSITQQKNPQKTIQQTKFPKTMEETSNNTIIPTTSQQLRPYQQPFQQHRPYQQVNPQKPQPKSIISRNQSEPMDKGKIEEAENFQEPASK
ncbi:unnamed protein product [Ceratitis capitata]|uniref:(Mediterranean fruit fly) hypothetical protein n=1 Tax=Ceratitis capitata TaxID=7213 RepID=A0A811UF69_CERCA|nr:unnamed protein product [Ceratitis capitata]